MGLQLNEEAVYKGHIQMLYKELINPHLWYLSCSSFLHSQVDKQHAPANNICLFYDKYLKYGYAEHA